MIDKSSEAYGEKGYKWGNHLFYTPGGRKSQNLIKNNLNFYIALIQLKFMSYDSFLSNTYFSVKI
jgi:hypothetical protein